MRKLGLLLSLVIVLLLAMVSPAAAAARTSGNGMNREGGPSTHPGKGWQDPGQDQGSAANTADPDCTGNRTRSPQPTNVGACDTPTGAADKPGGQGGFNADRDWNNGCGNDTDFEDDNNGRCLGPNKVHVQPAKTPPPAPTGCGSQICPHPPVKPCPETPQPPQHPSNPPPHPTNPPLQPPSTPPSHPTGPVPQPTVTPPTPAPVVHTPAPASPPVVTVERPTTPEAPTTGVPTVVTVMRPAAAPTPTIAASGPLPFTGPRHTVDFSALGLSLIAVGSALVRTTQRRA